MSATCHHKRAVFVDVSSRLCFSHPIHMFGHTDEIMAEQHCGHTREAVNNQNRHISGTGHMRSHAFMLRLFEMSISYDSRQPLLLMLRRRCDVVTAPFCPTAHVYAAEGGPFKQSHSIIHAFAHIAHMVMMYMYPSMNTNQRVQFTQA